MTSAAFHELELRATFNAMKASYDVEFFVYFKMFYVLWLCCPYYDVSRRSADDVMDDDGSSDGIFDDTIR